MAKDDYHVIVYKILAYLYMQLKNGDDVNPQMLKHDGKLFQINEKYWVYIIRTMLENDYIRDVCITRAYGRNYIVDDLNDIQITPQGIDYLCNNSLAEKAKAFLKDIKEITPFI